MLKSKRYDIVHFINKFLLKRRLVFTASLFGLNHQTSVDLAEYSHDYIRYSMWELIAQEICAAGLSGNVAELGVYKGNSAKLLNTLFPDKKLYLLDTFEGFDNRDLQIEIQNQYSSGKIEFDNTSAESVLARMPYRENCIVKKGFFPDTAKDIDDAFVFVSIDVDLYQPIYEGLKFFYPRLVRGGYLFVHDYNHSKFKGAKAAVQQYSREMNLTYLPIADTAGSVVFMK